MNTATMSGAGIVDRAGITAVHEGHVPPVRAAVGVSRVTVDAGDFGGFLYMAGEEESGYGGRGRRQGLRTLGEAHLVLAMKPWPP